MASVSVTNTFTSGTTADASQVNTNFTDITTYINNRNSGSATWDMVSVSHATNVPGTFNNSTGTQDILRCQDNGSNVLVVPDGGIITMGSQSGARVYASGSQTIPTTTLTKVTWDTESYDVKSEFGSNKFTATVTGKYLITAKVTWSNSTAQKKYVISVYVNGVAVASDVKTVSASAIGLHSSGITTIQALAATDYVEIYIYHDKGSDESIVQVDSAGGGAATGFNYFAVQKLA